MDVPAMALALRVFANVLQAGHTMIAACGFAPALAITMDFASMELAIAIQASRVLTAQSSPVRRSALSTVNAVMEHVFVALVGVVKIAPFALAPTIALVMESAKTSLVIAILVLDLTIALVYNARMSAQIKERAIMGHAIVKALSAEPIAPFAHAQMTALTLDFAMMGFAIAMPDLRVLTARRKYAPTRALAMVCAPLTALLALVILDGLDMTVL